MKTHGRLARSLAARVKMPARWTLRARLVVAAVALTAVALVLANAVGLTLLRNYLVDRLDDQLGATGAAATSGIIAGRQVLPLPGPQPGVKGFPLLTPQKRIVERMVGERGFYLFTPGGRLAAEFPGETVNKPDLGSLSEVRKGEPYTVPGTDGPSWRVLAVDLPDGGIVVMSASLAEVEETQRWLMAIDAAVMAAVLLLLGLAAAALVRLGIRPLTRMEETAAQIAAGDFSRRVPQPDPHTEPGRLGVAMNVMLDRVEAEIAARVESEARMRRFLADASHELRTPLTSVQGFAELYRRGGTPPGPPMDETMRRIEDEATRMGLLVNDLLVLAHLDEERPLEAHPVDLLQIAVETVRDARARLPVQGDRPAGILTREGARATLPAGGDARDRLPGHDEAWDGLPGHDEAWDGPPGDGEARDGSPARGDARDGLLAWGDGSAGLPGRQLRLTGLGSGLSPVMVLGDEARLRQVAANLVANALAHTPQDAKITVRVGTGKAAASPAAALGAELPGSQVMGVLEVCDTGPGISEDHAPRIFERLYRISESRSRVDGGAGLGLAIVAGIVKAHGGRVELTTTPGEGATFRVLLPLHDCEAPRG
ncbi:HAMP domain-containing sensor histidine kinase [Sphaerisporangium flaviroseum]|uniref:sensor histidine kinase n=1 Tax=Sphaerisporangium flaviroseum TaxID=509199 RepID=UPI0031E69FEA